MTSGTQTRKADSLRVRLFFVFLQTMHKNRRLYKLFGPAVALLALTQCASVQEAEMSAPAVGTFEVFATPGDTRTVNDGMSTAWLNGDKFNLFHAPAGAGSYVSDGAFTVDDPETGHAVGNVQSLGTGQKDWFLLYPYASSATLPTAVPVTVGAPVGSSQVQVLADDMASLAGPYFPLMGRALAVPADAVPSLTVAPALSVLAVNVTNATDSPVAVTQVRFKAPEAIVGSFKVDVTGAEPVYTAVSAADEAVLSVNEDVFLPAGDNGVFYLGIKPFTAGAGTTLTLTVNDEVRTVTLTRPVTFSAGKIKTLNMTLEASGPGDPGTYFFKRAQTASLGKTYLFVAEDEEGSLRMATALPAGSGNGRLAGVDVEANDGVITLESLDNAFSFFQGEHGTLIRQADERYLYNASATNNNVYAGTALNNTGYYWTITLDAAGRATIVNMRNRQLKYNEEVGSFEARMNTDNLGQLFYLYELQNSESAVAEFLAKETPGVYAYNGQDWLYTEGSQQLSVRTSGSSLAFRLFDPAAYTAVQVTGLPVDLAEKDRFTVRMVRSVKQAATHVAEFEVQAVRIADGKAWLMAGNGTGFIVCIQ